MSHSASSEPGPDRPRTEASVTAEVLEMLAALSPADPPPLGAADDFIKALGLRSIDVLRFLMEVESRYGLLFGDDAGDFDSLDSLGGVVRWILSRQGAGLDSPRTDGPGRPFHRQ